MNVVGIDLSLTSTALASDVDVTTLKTPANKISGMRRLSYIRDEIMSYLGGTIEHSGMITLVAIEGYSFGSKGSAIFNIGELGGVIRLTLWENGIEYVDVPPPILKKYATGAGNASKDQVLVQAVRRSGLELQGNDESDAWWLYAMARDGLGEPVLDMPALNREALKKILWTPVEVAVVG